MCVTPSLSHLEHRPGGACKSKAADYNVRRFCGRAQYHGQQLAQYLTVRLQGVWNKVYCTMTFAKIIHFVLTQSVKNIKGRKKKEGVLPTRRQSIRFSSIRSDERQLLSLSRRPLPSSSLGLNGDHSENCCDVRFDHPSGSHLQSRKETQISMFGWDSAMRQNKNEPHALCPFRACSYEPGWPGWPGQGRSRPPTTSFVKIPMCSYENQASPVNRDLGLGDGDFDWPRWKYFNCAWQNGRLAALVAVLWLICPIFHLKSLPFSCSNKVTRVDKATARGTIEISYVAPSFIYISGASRLFHLG